MALFETVTHLGQGADVLRRRRYGVIEVETGRLQRVLLRPYPKLISLGEITLAAGWRRRRRSGDRCRLYYNQPRRYSNFLALIFVVSDNGASFQSFRRGVAVLDEIARIKRSDALLCDVSNLRISDRLMRRWGWEPHKPQWLHRNYIKRFYGKYTQTPPALREVVE